jgi:hypothetical protein
VQVLMPAKVVQMEVLAGQKKSSIRTRHYLRIRDRQEQLEASLERAWAQDPVVLAETEGTPKVHIQKEAVN